MLRLGHWAESIFSLCIIFVSGAVADRCSSPESYGGHPIEAYLIKRVGNSLLPWTVAIRTHFGKFKCLGSIILDPKPDGSHKNSSLLVLTAGSCFYHLKKKRYGRPSEYRIYAGVDRLKFFMTRGQKSTPMAIRVMPYTLLDKRIWNGVALVTLRRSFLYTKTVSPVCVARAYNLPPENSACFVSTYDKGQLGQKLVKMVPGVMCDFGHFPEFADTTGMCSRHYITETEKSHGAPLVCMVDGRVYQYGVYLSPLVTAMALSFHQALHFYAHVTAVLERNPETVPKTIQLGSYRESQISYDPSSELARLGERRNNTAS